jgi:hypothetical protein
MCGHDGAHGTEGWHRQRHAALVMGVMGVGTRVGTEGMGVIGGDTLRQCWDGRQ